MFRSSVLALVKESYVNNFFDEHGPDIEEPVNFIANMIVGGRRSNIPASLADDVWKTVSQYDDLTHISEDDVRSKVHDWVAVAKGYI